jgi:hypothetical protein
MPSAFPGLPELETKLKFLKTLTCKGKNIVKAVDLILVLCTMREVGGSIAGNIRIQLFLGLL